MSIAYLRQRFEEAEKLGTWDPLIGYWKLLFSWQARHPKDVKVIARLASHWHGYTHRNCKKITEFHPIPHNFCTNACKKMDSIIKANLQTRFALAIMKRKEDLAQQLLFDETSNTG